MKKIMIIGAGFAGLSAAQRLSASGLGSAITLFDPKAQFNFLPLIPDCIGRAVNPRFLIQDVANLSGQLKIRFIQEAVTGVDLASGQLQTALSNYAYDYLLIASGSQPNFFSDSAAQAYSYPLNSVLDAQKIIGCLKENKFQNVIICGAGYTGVEAAGNLWLYFKKRGLFKKIIIVERSPAVLGALPAWMKDYVARNLKSMGIEVFINSVIEKVKADQVSVSGGREFSNSMLVWVPGVKTAEFIQKLDLAKNPQGRIAVDEYLRVKQNCFCAGDTAWVGEKNSFLRMAIAFAIAQGERAAENIIRSIKNMPLKKYRPLDLGYIIPLANNHSCGQALGLNVSGYLATFLHFSMCIFRTRGLKNKVGIINNLIKNGR
ncbi:MAG: FAD-dependent oxidoreductase [Candidatus Omnitrophota bacterium]